MNYPGNNVMQLCAATLIRILEKSLNEGRTEDVLPIHVKDVWFRDLSYHVYFTTDEETK